LPRLPRAAVIRKSSRPAAKVSPPLPHVKTARDYRHRRRARFSGALNRFTAAAD
jgi:hypothetical protein